MLLSGLMAVGLVATAVVLLRAHRRTWKSLQRKDLPPERRRFGRRQFRRRTTASSLMGLIGVAVLASPAMRNPHLARYWLYWLGMLILVLSMSWLALLDALDTLRYFRTVHSALLAKHTADADDSDDLRSSELVDRTWGDP